MGKERNEKKTGLTQKEIKRHKRFMRNMKKLLVRFIMKKFAFDFDQIDNSEEPCLILANHNTDYDPVFMGIALKEHAYFVASEHVTHKGILSKLLMYWFHPIIHQKGKAGLKTAIEIIKTLQAGYSVVLFPEGNRSFDGVTEDIGMASAKLAKKTKAPVITVRFEGGYLTQPRWGNGVRRGKLYVRFVHKYSLEEMTKMSDEEFYAALKKDLHEDADERRKIDPVEYRGKRPAFGLERVIYRCPYCGKFKTMVSSDNHIKCRSCERELVWDDTGYLMGYDGSIFTVRNLCTEQREKLKRKIENDPAKELFRDQVIVEKYNDKHEVEKSEKGEIVVYGDHVELGDKKIYSDDLLDLAIVGKNKLVVFRKTDQAHFEIKGEELFNALVYRDLYRANEEGK